MEKIFHFPLPGTWMLFIYLFFLLFLPDLSGCSQSLFSFKELRKTWKKKKERKKKKAPRVPQDGQNRSELPVTSADLIPSSGRTFHVTQLRVFVSGTKDVSPLSLSILLVRFNPPFSLLLSRSS